MLLKTLVIPLQTYSIEDRKQTLHALLIVKITNEIAST